MQLIISTCATSSIIYKHISPNNLHIHLYFSLRFNNVYISATFITHGPSSSFHTTSYFSQHPNSKPLHDVKTRKSAAITPNDVNATSRVTFIHTFNLLTFHVHFRRVLKDMTRDKTEIAVIWDITPCSFSEHLVEAIPLF